MTIQFEHNPLADALVKHHVFSGTFLGPLFDECFGCFDALYRINPNWFARVWKCPKDIEVFHHEYGSACMRTRQLAPVHLNKKDVWFARYWELSLPFIEVVGINWLPA
jgi:hypothetical protein